LQQGRQRRESLSYRLLGIRRQQRLRRLELHLKRKSKKERRLKQRKLD
jgi:hypothetical protein